MKIKINSQYRFATFVAVLGTLSNGMMRFFENGSYNAWEYHSYLSALLSLATAVVIFIEHLLLRKYKFMPIVIVSTITVSLTIGSYITTEWDYYYLASLSMIGVMCLYGQIRSLILYQFANTVLNIAVLLFLLDNAPDGFKEHMFMSFLLYLYGVVFLTVLFYRAYKRQDVALRGVQSFSSLLSSTPNLMVIVDGKRNVRYISARLAEFAGMDDTIAIGRPLIDLFKEESIKLMFADILDADDFYSATREIDMNDEQHYYKIIADKLLDSDEGMFIEITDMTEIVLASMKADESRKEAEEANQSKSTFLATMSHEIRTPMNAIQGMAELALREDIPITAYEHVLAIKQSGENLLSIINDILDFSKIESGKLEIVTGDYLFASLINDVINIIRTRTMDSHLRFVANIDSSIPNALIGDEIRIRQVLLNLLSNAVKYTEEGFVSLSVACEITGENTVTLIIEVADSGRGIKEEDMDKLFGDFVQIDLVKNKGIEGTGLGLAITRNFVKAMGGGITVSSEYGKGSAFTVTLPQEFCQYEKLASVENPEEKSVLVYERREIYAKSIVQTVENLGVSCTIATTELKFYEEMAKENFTFVFISSFLIQNGKRVNARLGSDAKVVLLTEFGEAIAERSLGILTMPVHPISVANILNGISDSCAYGESKGINLRFIAPSAKILIVDDVNTNLKVAEGLMLPYNMQIDLSKSGRDAVAAVRSNCYDLVLMDHMMPEMDGVEATRRIRELDVDYSKSVPIIALTANAVSGAREMFLQNGFDDFLSKPIETTKLNAILEKWIPKEKQKKFVDKNDEVTHYTIEISGVDTARGIAMTGGKLDNYLKTLSVFHKDGMQKIDEIRSSLETDNLPLYVICVHALKSVLASIGAGELSETAKALEVAGNQEDLIFIGEHNDNFLLELEALLVSISEAIPTSNREEPPISENLEMMKVALSVLKSALEAFDSGAIDSAMDFLQAFTADGEFGTVIQSILQNALIGEYAGALALIDTLLENTLFQPVKANGFVAPAEGDA